MSSENIPGGYNCKILRVNLSTNSITTEEITESFCRKYLGGAGFVAYYLLKELRAGVDPLGPENKLVFATGPLTGIKLSGSARHCVGAKSPLSNTIAKAEAGEYWGVELKYAGFDAVIVEGKAEKPVYISIVDGQVAINDAAHLWGKNTKETQEIIRAEMKDARARVALIGPGGEKLVKYACIMHGLFDAAGRGGLGAVMGSKKLKAIAVRGHNPPPIKSPERVKEFREWLTANIEKVKMFQDLGSGAYMAPYEASGNLPVRNFRDGLFPNAAAIEGKTIKETIRTGMDGCFGCIVRCKKVVKVTTLIPLTRLTAAPNMKHWPHWGLIAASITSRPSAKAMNYAMPIPWTQFPPASVFLSPWSVLRKELSRLKIPAGSKSGLGIPKSC